MTYHPDDEEEGEYGPTWFMTWPMWLFIVVAALCAAGIWQMTEWACDLWRWARLELLKGGLL
jgi:hypothetical protein